ncbi:T9SS type A sorting domain-containing protein [Dyadobacter tibetensis]|uniref:T9SS type A sorting domain-containing protein n=1 Tax=Dyadobacter tibetensis TaxID=1211851 RepID=UPI00046E9565|nr:T9SS type A sorting domain-containing protein [Dyadobacter tibetensis]
MKITLPIVLKIVLFCIAISLESLGQISINYPMDRLVVQRNSNNRATIRVSGSFKQHIDKVEARLVALQGGSNIDWHVLQNSPQGGFFEGSIEAFGGWYKLEVRGKNGASDVGMATVEHVGIGEVFIVSGQSNAQGYDQYGSPEVTDDRVNTVNFDNINDSGASGLPYPQFSHLDTHSKISPRGLSAWAWGALGDKLAQRLNVPILFFNTGYEGTQVRTWRESISGTAYSPYAPYPYSPSGMPFINLRWVMQYYIPITGLRAVLWEQGEADNYFANHPEFATTSDKYALDLKAVIEANRRESGKNVSWMISLSSYDNSRGVNQMVRNGQLQAISTSTNTFQGPDTDIIQIPRDNTFNRGDGVHFTDGGISQLAQAWNAKLDDAFFNSSIPHPAVGPLSVSVACSGSSLRLTVTNSGYSAHSWSNGQAGTNITVGNGSFRAKALDSFGNYIFSPEIIISEAIQGPKPTISIEGSNPVCLGNTATLISSATDAIKWNTGSTSPRLPVTASGQYTVTSQSVYGCENTSDPYQITILTSPLPAKPSIQAGGATTFCEGGSVTLQSSSSLKNVWSNGATSASIQTSQSGTFTVKALDNVGCFSPESDPVTVKVNPNPAKPQIALSRNPNFCEGETLVLTSNYDSGNLWNTGSTSKAVTTTISGTFSVTQTDINGCKSVSDVITTKVNPLPATPSIVSLKPTTFCERDFTLLQSTPAYIYVWSNGSNNPEIAVYESGDYTISAKDANGCISPPSAVTKVVKNPLPPRPSITASGPTTFCADKTITLQAPSATAYKWSSGQSTASIAVNNTGSFYVQTLNEYNCISDPSSTINTRALALPPAPVVTLEGPATFCAGDQTRLAAQPAGNIIWSDGQTQPVVSIGQSGTYTARLIDTQGCYSVASNSVTIDAKPAPTVPEIRQVGVYTLQAENNLHSGIFNWQKDGKPLSQTSISIKSAESGVFQVSNSIVYSPQLTCSSALSEPFTFVATVNAGEMIIYPNPMVSDNLTLETWHDLSNATIQIIDLRGIVHKTIQIQELKTQQFIRVSDLSAGTYLVRVLSDNYSGVKKFVVAR